MNEDLAKDTTLESVILDKLSADKFYEGCTESIHYSSTSTWTWEPKREFGTGDEKNLEEK